MPDASSIIQFLRACYESDSRQSAIGSLFHKSIRHLQFLEGEDRLLCGLGSLFLSPGRLRKVAIGVRPSTLLQFHQALVRRKYRRLFSSSGRSKTPVDASRPPSSRHAAASMKAVKRFGL